MPGQRLFVEGLTVSGERAEVVLRAAADLDLVVRAYGGPGGRWSRYYAVASLDQGERASYDLPLHGPSPSLVFSWTDELGQAGAVSLEGEQLPWPLPAASGELCSLRVTSLGWTPGVLAGVVASTCASTVEEAVVLQTASGHAEVTTKALLEGEVTALAGTVTVASGAREITVSFVAGGETRFRLPVAVGEGVRPVTIEAALEASLRVPLPPVVELTHSPRRTERLTETASVGIPAFGDTVTETVTIPNEDGTFTEYAVTASCYVPASTVRQDVVFTVVHDERVEAAVTEREPIGRSRQESLSLAASVWADGPHRALAVPEPEPEPIAGRAGPRRRRRAARPLRRARLGVALVRRLTTALLLCGVALVTTGAAPEEERAMLDAFDAALTAMAYAAAGLTVFSIVWAGFLLMADGAEERGFGRARSAVFLAVAGLALVLSAKGVAALLRAGVLPFFTP